MVPSAKPWRLSGIAGLLFVGLSFVASGMNVQLPVYDQEPEALVSWFAENGRQYRIGHFMAGLAFLLFYFPFFSGLCERLRHAEGAPAVWARVTWAGAIISPAVGTIAGTFIVGAALLGSRVSPDIARFAIASNFYAYVVSGALSGIVMLGAAVVILRTSIFSRWVGWAGAVIGVAAIAGSAAVAENDPVGLFAAINGFAWRAYFLWIAAVSIALIRRVDTSAHP
jgi:hypothetical protein